jgi:acylphosphatase
MVQAHIIYSGVVQGVGFRLTTQRKAEELHLAGWVRNLSDGRVEILVQGSQSSIEKFFLTIQNRFQENITERKTEMLPQEDADLVFFDIYPTL